MSKTKVFVEEFKGNEMFAIWNVDEKGEKVGAFPVISFGVKKAQAIVEHAEELKAFADSRKK